MTSCAGAGDRSGRSDGTGGRGGSCLPGTVELRFAGDTQGSAFSRISELLLRHLRARGVATNWLGRVDEYALLCREVELVPLAFWVCFRIAEGLAARTGLAIGTACEPPIVELHAQAGAPEGSLLNDDHVRLLGLAPIEELPELRAFALRAGRVLRAILAEAAIDLQDLRLLLGRGADGFMLACEISPSTCCFCDAADGRVLGEEVLSRIERLPEPAADVAAEDAAPRLKRIRFELVVRPRPFARDPQAEAIGEALSAAGFSGFAVECAGRYLRLDVHAESLAAARAQIAEACRAMLVNPNLEIYDLRAVDA